MDNLMQIISPVFWLAISILLVSRLIHNKKYVYSALSILVIISLQFFGEVVLQERNYLDAFVISLAVGGAAIIIAISSAHMRKASQTQTE